MTVISIWTKDEGKKSGKCTRTWIAFQIANDAVSSFRLVRVGVVLVQLKKLWARPHIRLPLFWWDFNPIKRNIIQMICRNWWLRRFPKSNSENHLIDKPGSAYLIDYQTGKGDLLKSYYGISHSFDLENVLLSDIKLKLCFGYDTTQQRLWTVLDS